MKRLFSILTAAALLVFTACGSPPSAETPESAEGQQIRLTVGDIQIDITLNGSQAAAALVQMLPLELTLIERNYFAKGMLLPDPLPDTEQTTRAYAVGDLGYWADGQNLAIFYDDIFALTSVPIIPLGRAETVRNSYPIFLGQRRWNCCRTQRRSRWTEYPCVADESG